jgi:hypothetical protein
MKNEVSEKEKEDNKDKAGNTFIYAVILFGSMMLAVLALILKVLGLF